jgi:spore maturation protein CgeB
VIDKLNAPAWKKLTEKGAAVTKVLLPMGNFFLQEELFRSFPKCGIEPICFYHERCASGMEYEQKLDRLIQSRKPDCILSVNMKGFDGEGALSALSQRYGLPVIVWFVDDPHPILLHQKQFVHSEMIALSWERSYIPFLERCGFSRVSFLPLGTDPTLFNMRPAAHHRIPLGFVGSSMGHRFLRNNIANRFLWSEKLVPIAETSADFLLENRSADIADTVRKTTEKLGSRLPFTDERNFTWLCSYVIHLASMKKRKNTMDVLMEMGIETFGDSKGWSELLGPSVKTHPDIAYNAELSGIYNSIAVNINITSCQMPTAVNQRVFDIPMSGSLVISDYQEDLSLLFEPGTEAVCYHNGEELRSMISRYMNNPADRNKIICAAQKKILAEHTYEARIRKMLTLLS